MTNLKKYTLSDLQEKKIAVKINNYEEYKRLCDAVGDADDNKSYFDESWDYYGVDEDGDFIRLTLKELEGRILLSSIDEIDLGDEGKEEVKPYLIVEDENTINHIQQLESEIARLKGEVEELKGKNERVNKAFDELLSVNKSMSEMMKSTQSPDLTKRERMAWEYLLKSIGSIEGKTWSVKAETAFEIVDTFLAKSKEVGNG